MYDLDKTQEWLNRTMQVGRTPAMRGGLRSDRTWRRQVAAMVALTLIILLACISIHVPHGAAASSLATADNPQRAADSALAEARAIVARPAVILAPARVPVPVFVDPDAEAVRLSGNIQPQPGSVPPPAPIWLDSSVAHPARR